MITEKDKAKTTDIVKTLLEGEGKSVTSLKELLPSVMADLTKQLIGQKNGDVRFRIQRQMKGLCEFILADSQTIEPVKKDFAEIPDIPIP